nr:MAG TPA: hypothetical protein [Caudoviricetes sp.]
MERKELYSLIEVNFYDFGGFEYYAYCYCTWRNRNGEKRVI